MTLKKKLWIAFGCGVAIGATVALIKKIKNDKKEQSKNVIEDDTIYIPEDGAASGQITWNKSSVTDDEVRYIQEMEARKEAKFRDLDGEIHDRPVDNDSQDGRDTSEQISYENMYKKRASDYEKEERKIAEKKSSKSYKAEKMKAKMTYADDDYYDEDEDDSSDERVLEIDENIPKPYIISEDDFHDGYTYFDKLGLTFYTENHVLVTEDDEEVTNIDSLVGEDNLEPGYPDEDVARVYIRNEGLGADFEISFVNETWVGDGMQ